MIVANMAGIKIFATGGIGGVHRGQPHDVSADLTELGQTPVTVVSSGAKSILDLAADARGAWKRMACRCSAIGRMSCPPFTQRARTLPIDRRIDSAAEAAAIIRAAEALGAQNGILVAVPAPVDLALDRDEAEAAIEQATREAEASGIGGKDITPYVLNRVSELTKGASMKANIALLINNSRIAGDIARELSRR